MLRSARASAAGGAGRVVLVTGEPGIGKTALVGRVRARSRAATRACCSAPATTSPSRGRSGRSATSPAASPRRSRGDRGGRGAARGADAARRRARAPPRPTVLVLEDVHWADDATFDSITVLGRRIGSLPALLVLTFGRGEAPPGHPLHAALGAIPADARVFLELAPLSKQAVATLAGDAGEGVRRERRQPVLRHRAARARARRRRCRRRSRPPCSVAPRGWSPTRAGWSSSSRSSRTACRSRCSTRS